MSIFPSLPAPEKVQAALRALSRPSLMNAALFDKLALHIISIFSGSRHVFGAPPADGEL
jgi:hypothetical protein